MEPTGISHWAEGRPAGTGDPADRNRRPEGVPLFSSDDLSQLEAQGISPDDARAQLGRMSRGFPRVHLDRPCTVGDGLLQLRPDERADCVRAFERARDAGRISKFVPASGAATRMFQALLSAHGSGLDLGPDTLERLEAAGSEADALLSESGLNEEEALLTVRFLRAIGEFPFVPDLAAALGVAGASELVDLVRAGPGRRILEAVLGERGLALATLPKGLIPFHHYSDGAWTPFAEHLAEGWELLAEGGQGHPIRIHFTVPPGFESTIRTHLEQVATGFPGAQFEVELSIQSPATDTIAGDLGGGPYRTPGGQLVFRPGGHGALLSNLANLGGDLVLLKNVDNIARRSWRRRQHPARRCLAGLLVRLEEQVLGWREELARIAETPGAPDTTIRLDRLEAAYVRTFSRTLEPLGSPEPTHRIERFRGLLGRPIRVCGMVANEGEPGGGPFWVRHPDGSRDIQIVELSQIDRSDPAQARALEGATHFNPVDLAVSLRGSDGRNYDLRRFVDEETGIVAEKSDGGRRLRALELPGLWNGSMAAWNTVFVETPTETFTPVKTVLDLLRAPHRRED